MQSGKHVGHTIRARVLHQPPPRPFSYFDKGNMATLAVSYAIMEKDRLRLSGIMGKAGWAFIHILYLGRAEGQLMLGMQWIFNLFFGKPGSSYIETPLAEMAQPVQHPAQAAPPAREGAQSAESVT